MSKIDFSKNLILDGAMGSLLLERGFTLPPEKLMRENPTAIKQVHLDYINAGSDVIYANTFGLNPFKSDNLKEDINLAISIAKSATPEYVALDIGPLGKIVGDGGMSFDESYNAFKEIIISANDQTDYIAIETMTSLTEARAAILAAKENSSLPITITMSFDKGGRTFFGVDTAAFAVTMESLGVSALGANCSIGPFEMMDIAKDIISSTSLPVIIKPNAGMPKLENGKTLYDVNSHDFSRAMIEIKKLGVNILGGCCGTTPEYIKELKETTKDISLLKRKQIPQMVASAYTATTLNGVIGERINPTGKKKIQVALREGNYDFLVAEGIKQEKQGAKVLDINVGVSGIDEEKAMLEMIHRLSQVTTLPLQIDSSKPEVIDKALRYYDGRAIINSVNGSTLDKILPLAKKYGAVVIGLAMDENGIPESVEGRLKIADIIIKAGKSYGISKDRFLIDALTLSEASQKYSALTTLKTVKALTEKGIKTTLGISNISFGMPSREIINASFLKMAYDCGLSMPIFNPKFIGLDGNSYADDFLLAKEGAVEKYIASSTNETLIKIENTDSLVDLIVTGQAESVAEKVKELALKQDKMEIAKEHIIPALEEIGNLYEEKKVFLPQLIAASDAAKTAFDALDFDSITNDSKDVFLIATVKGDIHDIGKNIVKSITSNYGFKVIDLGRDVDYDIVLKAVKDNYPCVLGLSALMTTTAENMATTIRLIKEKFDIPILVGGAVLTKEYADLIGGIYCVDAQDTVKHLKEIFKK